MTTTPLLFATDYTGALQGLIWLAVHGFYFVMLLITAIACMGRRTRTTDDLTHSLVWGGVPLVFSLMLVAWAAYDSRPPKWTDFWWFAKFSLVLWSAAVALRWWHQKT